MTQYTKYGSLPNHVDSLVCWAPDEAQYLEQARVPALGRTWSSTWTAHWLKPTILLSRPLCRATFLLGVADSQQVCPDMFNPYPVVEVQQTFYQPPLPQTLEKWRRQAAPGL